MRIKTIDGQMNITLNESETLCVTIPDGGKYKLQCVNDTIETSYVAPEESMENTGDNIVNFAVNEGEIFCVITPNGIRHMYQCVDNLLETWHLTPVMSGEQADILTKLVNEKMLSECFKEENIDKCDEYVVGNVFEEHKLTKKV